MRESKKLQELTIKDNFMFGVVMTDEENCKDFLELTLGFHIEKVTVSKERSIVYHPGYKGERLDVIAKDEKRTHYNIEMQVVKYPALGKRTRYYHSQINMELLKTGLDYEQLPSAYVIFICDYDPFGKKLYRYTWDMICRECKILNMNDGCHTVILSTCGQNEGEVPEELVKFLKYVGASLEESKEDFDDAYVRRLQASVEHIKISRDMEERYMTWEEFIKYERKDAKEEGRIEGKIENIIEILSESFQTVPDHLVQRLYEVKEKENLKIYLRYALKAKSVEEFEEMIK